MTLLLILLFILLSAMFSGFETGGYLLNRIRLRYRARHGDRAARRLQRVLADAHLFIFTVLIGNNIAVYLVSRSVTQLYLRAGISEHSEDLFGFIPWSAETAATLTLMLPLFLFAEIIPKNLFRRQADILMYRLSGGLLLVWRLLLPITTGLKMLFNLLTGGRGRSDRLSGISLSLEGLREYFSEESRRTALSDHQHGMIDNLVSMHRKPVRDLMQPAASIISVAENATVRKTLDLLRARGVEQIAVYSGSVRRLIGFVTLFDLMDPILKPTDSIRPHVRKMIRLPAGMPLTHAFRRLRLSPATPAVVMDRSSLAVGMLHLRDIADYIVNNGSTE
ncbi:MAG: DUF21 domain-containing protein [Verrucomicrobia bacterium]|nr:DUF21 domain-containing protein [Verrucomicrobiota bacterium]